MRYKENVPLWSEKLEFYDFPHFSNVSPMFHLLYEPIGTLVCPKASSFQLPSFEPIHTGNGRPLADLEHPGSTRATLA